MSLLRKIVGKPVTAVSADVAVYVAINPAVAYPDGGSLNLTKVIQFDQFELQVINPVEVITTKQQALVGVSDLIGKTVETIKDEPEEVTITFSDGCMLKIDLRDESYVGPEAMVLSGPNDLIVVWN